MAVPPWPRFSVSARRGKVGADEALAAEARVRTVPSNLPGAGIPSQAQVADEVQDDWDLASVVQIARWARQVIHVLGERTERPTYHETSYFAR